MIQLREIFNVTFCFILLNTIVAQGNNWNLLLDKKSDRFIGFQVFELDSSYVVWGPSVESFDSTD